MVIGVDAGCLGIIDKNLQVGVYQVAKNLFIQLAKLDKKNTYILYSFHPIDPPVLKTFGKNVRNTVVKPSKGWMKLWLPLRLAQDKVDLFIGLSQALPFSLGKPRYRSIAFVYDVAFEEYPDMYPDSLAKLHNQTQYVAKHANQIITISQTTKKELLKKFSFDPSAITVAYPGPRDLGNSSGKSKEKYFLFVGALKRIKNVPVLIKAFQHFLTRTKGEYYLYIAGGSVWYDPAIDQALQLNKEHIKFLGFAQESEMNSLYKNAIAFVSPSLYEGFGLPFVEAMASGCPVIGSTAGALPEVVGEAGILVDPYDVDGLADAMYKIASNHQFRKQMKEKGLKRAKKFSWEKFAKDVLQVINTN